MAGKDFAVRATPAAATAIDGLRGRARKKAQGADPDRSTRRWRHLDLGA